MITLSAETYRVMWYAETFNVLTYKKLIKRRVERKGGRSVGIVRSRTKGHGVSFFVFVERKGFQLVTFPNQFIWLFSE
jgi:hypothetical protein